MLNFDPKFLMLLPHSMPKYAFKMLLGSNANFLCSNLLYKINILEICQKSQQNLSLVMLIARDACLKKHVICEYWCRYWYIVRWWFLSRFLNGLYQMFVWMYTVTFSYVLFNCWVISFSNVWLNLFILHYNVYTLW